MLRSRHRLLLSVVIVFAVWCTLSYGHQAGAHATILRSDPPIDGLLAAPPQRLDLWMSEPIAVGNGSPTLRLLDQSGRDLTVTDVHVDPADATHLQATVRGLGTGTFTIVWSNRSATDGHTLSGSYAFRVASSTRAPGAATTEGDTPAAWAVGTRWLTFLGAALVAGGFGLARFVLRGVESRTGDRRRQTVIAIGAVVGLLATLAEPVLQTQWPPNGALAPRFSDAVHALPRAWWIRPAALVLSLLVAVLLPPIMRRRASGAAIGNLLGMATGLATMLGLSLTSHAAGRADWRSLAIVSNVLHQWSIALWVGGLAHLALGWLGRELTLDAVPVRRFSRVALGLAAIGIGTGVLNAGLVLPRIRALWSSTYGDVILLKVGVLIPVLVLATVHRTTLRRAADHLGAVMRRTIRLEAALVLLVVLGGSLLALLAPPGGRGVEAGRPTQVDLRQPILAAVPGQETWVHLITQPATAGASTFTVALKQGDGTPVVGESPALVRLTIASLDEEIAASTIEATPTGQGLFVASGSQLSLDGWWRIEVTLRWLGRADVMIPYYLLLPDPNLYGLDAPQPRAAEPEATQLYDQTMVQYTALHRIRYRQLMLDGRGKGAMSEHVVNDGTDGSAPGFYYHNITVNGWEAIVLNDRMWTRYPGEAWEEGDGQAMIPPARWDDEFHGATDFQLGRTEEIDGERCQVVTCVVPDAPGRVVAWYVWWVGTETGRLRRDAMISRSHYMINNFSDFDAPLTVEPPMMPLASPSPVTTGP